MRFEPYPSTASWEHIEKEGFAVQVDAPVEPEGEAYVSLFWARTYRCSTEHLSLLTAKQVAMLWDEYEHPYSVTITSSGPDFDENSQLWRITRTFAVLSEH